MNQLAVVLLPLILLVSSQALAGQKTFTREYTHRASDDDSKNTSRATALSQVRAELLLEAEVYIESYLQIEAIATEKSDREYIREEIKYTTAGTTQTQILEERWDGSTYYVKAKIELDPDEVVKSVNNALERRSNRAEIARLIQLLATKDADIAARSLEADELSKRLDSRNATIHEQRQALESLQRRLEEANVEIAEVATRQRDAVAEVQKILAQIDELSDRARTVFVVGLTQEEVRQLLGDPRARINAGTCRHGVIRYIAWNYGEVWYVFNYSTDLLVEMREWTPGTSFCSSRLTQ